MTKKIQTTYTQEDQEFFFEKANDILDRFGLLNNVPNDSVVDVILFFQDQIVNQLELFQSWLNVQQRNQGNNSSEIED